MTGSLDFNLLDWVFLDITGTLLAMRENISPKMAPTTNIAVASRRPRGSG